MHPAAPACALLIALGACAHVVHPARVTPGFSADALVAPTRVGHEDPTPSPPVDPTESSRQFDLQLDLRYGWEQGDGRGIQIELMAPWAVAVYRQFRARPDLGAGALIGPNPGLYGMVGNAWLDERGQGIDLNGGLRLHLLPAGGPEHHPVPNGAAFATLAGVWGGTRAGVLVEHVEFLEPATACDESCGTDDYTLRRTSVGLFISQAWQ